MIVHARPPRRTRKPRPPRPVALRITHAHTPHKIDRIRHFERRWGVEPPKETPS